MLQKLRSNNIAVKLVIIVLDAIMIVFSGGIALLARFDFTFAEIPERFSKMWLSYLWIQIAVTVVIFLICRMYSYIWHNVGLEDAARMIGSVLLAYGANYLIQRFAMKQRMPTSVVFVELVLQLILLVGMRCALRVFSELHARRGDEEAESRRILLVGGGSAGHMFLQELKKSDKTGGKVCCIIDDNPVKWSKYMDGVRIVGGRGKIPEMVKKYKINQIVLAIPTATAAQQRLILEICNSTGCHTRIIPGMYQLMNGEVTIGDTRDVQIEDLLGREPVRLDTDGVEAFLKDKVVLVTGGGGSIGSELCRQIAARGPKKLIIIDIYENNAYDIQQELRQKYRDALDLEVEIASVRDKDKIYELFDLYRPEIVFHAAAHKHVPLMEHCPSEAVKNNVFGTYHVVRAAERSGVKKFVMISTDKAVNPTNFMGATKRFTEMVMQSKKDSPTTYCAVRFGNVLGSNGSVVPLFKRQIAAGGPVTITDRRIIRYFMTIPEAAQLVLEAGAMAKQSQIFVLDMGEPVKILDLAENLIRLSGLEPYKDIDIKEIGLRPGEKLYEELLMASGNLSETANRKIFIEEQTELDPAQIMADLTRLDEAVTNHMPNDELIALLKSMVPTYRDPNQVNREAEKRIGE